MRDRPFYKGARFRSAEEMKDILPRIGAEAKETYRTIFSDPRGLAASEPVVEGHGEGSFVVMSAGFSKRDG